jgi:DNA-binding FrmR family transcriptional regulator
MPSATRSSGFAVPRASSGDGRDCAEVVTQLAAVSRALDRAGFKLIASGLQQCLTAEAAGEQPSIDQARLERLFLSLA